MREEKQNEDLKKQLIEQGMIPESSLQRLDWMYQDISKRDENLAEEFLMGKPIDERAAAKEDAGEDKFEKPK